MSTDLQDLPRIVTCGPERQSRIDALGYDYAAQPKQHADCPICDSEVCRVIADRDRYAFPIRAVECACGFVYLSPRMTAEAYGEFYQRWYRPLLSAHAGATFDATTIEPGAIRHTESVCRAIEKFAKHPSRKRALDIGGSCGVFAAELSKRWGYKSTVLDPSPDELKRAEERGCDTIQGLAETVETNDYHYEQFDLVSILQTTDHLLKPRLVFQRAWDWLSWHGLFVVEFIDYTVTARQVGLPGALKIDHPLYFTQQTARDLLNRTGFEPLNFWQSERHMLFVCRKVPR